MRKKIVTLAAGEDYQRLERASGPSRRAYAVRHGWDYEVIDQIPDVFRAEHPTARFGMLCYLYKLSIPSRNLDHDLVAFFDCDSLLTPNAPCLSEFAERLPQGGFGAVQTVAYEERRRLHPDWAPDYYAQLEKNGATLPAIPDRTTQINAGLLLFRPAEVHERWTELLHLNSPLNEESRLNVYEVQQGRCLLLPPEWNLLWMYEKYRLGILKPQSNFPLRLRNYLYNRVLGKPLERRRLREAFGRCHLLHLAFEHHKIHWLVDEPAP